MEDDTPIDTSNVVKGPWKRVKVISKSETDRVTDDMALIDEIAESIINRNADLAENATFRICTTYLLFIAKIQFFNPISVYLKCF